ncbi:MAG: signal peptidase I [Flavobacteriales bacterium]|nr:signal peptidase I [Flavobacteriales bacterium]
MAAVMIIYLAIIVLMIASMWKVFTKAGKPGWAAIVPIYNIIVLLQIVGRPTWWIILFLIPIVSFIIMIMVMIDVAKSFGKGGGFAAGLILLGIIFWPILAFGDAQYVGPAAAPKA